MTTHPNSPFALACGLIAENMTPQFRHLLGFGFLCRTLHACEQYNVFPEMPGPPIGAPHPLHGCDLASMMALRYLS
jgi:hypothetical protein